MSSKKIAVVTGARPNFIKAAPFLTQARNYPEFIFEVIHTGQHFDELMSKIFFEQMQIPKPAITLDIKAEQHTEKIGKMFSALDRVLMEKRYDGVVVFGDVNSTLAGAIAASTNRRPLIHIESGLRSHDRRMPEEINRVIVDHLSDYLFTTEQSANINLEKEGVDTNKVFLVGNLMIESIERYKTHIENSPILEKLGLEAKKYLVATIHRQENTDNPDALKEIFTILESINQSKPIILPLHPGTKNRIKEYGLESKLNKIHVIEPLGYFDFLHLIASSSGVITDSGGIQEETTHLGIPCCTLRDNTERPITLELGSNALFQIKQDQIEAMQKHLNKTFQEKPVPLWDAEVSSRILNQFTKIF